jgi:hypothetical protein
MARPIFSEQTLLPISLVVVLLSGVCGAAYWISDQASATVHLEERFTEYKSAHDAAIDAIEERDQRQWQVLLEVQRKLERMDAKVDYIYESTKRRTAN